MKTASKIMEAARDLFEEVEIEVPEGMELPTAIKSAESTEEGEVPDETAADVDESGADSEKTAGNPSTEEAKGSQEETAPAEPSEDKSPQ